MRAGEKEAAVGEDWCDAEVVFADWQLAECSKYTQIYLQSARNISKNIRRVLQINLQSAPNISNKNICRVAQIYLQSAPNIPKYICRVLQNHFQGYHIQKVSKICSQESKHLKERFDETCPLVSE